MESRPARAVTRIAKLKRQVVIVCCHFALAPVCTCRVLAGSWPLTVSQGSLGVLASWLNRLLYNLGAPAKMQVQPLKAECVRAVPRVRSMTGKGRIPQFPGLVLPPGLTLVGLAASGHPRWVLASLLLCLTLYLAYRRHSNACCPLGQLVPGVSGCLSGVDTRFLCVVVRPRANG